MGWTSTTKTHFREVSDMAKQTGIVDNGKLYAYRLPGEKKFFDFALKVDPDYHGFKGICFVSPPRHPHMIKGKLGGKTATGFTFIADKDAYAPGEWEFVELTYENFRDEFCKICMDGGESVLAEVSNTEELIEFYRNLE